MIIEKYGLRLERLREKDIELVRQKRNDREIARRMFYQKPISVEEQKQWFHTINTITDYYFLMHYKNEKVGLIHGNILSFENRIARGGLFIWDKKYQHSHLPVIASVCLTDITFLIMGMQKTLAEVRSDNKNALRYNLKLGYVIKEEQKDGHKLKLELTRKDYFERAAPIRKMVKRISRDESDISWDDLNLAPQLYAAHLYTGLPDYIQHKVDDKLNH